jgi:signal peptidase I
VSESADSADRVDPAADEPQARPPKKKRPFWVELPILIVIAFGLTFLIQTFIAKVY